MQRDDVDYSGVQQNRLRAVLLALTVTILWASSWVIIKFGLEDIPPLMFAGMRYGLASLVLMTVTLSRKKMRIHLKNKTKNSWGKLFLYGLLFITGTQGAQFVALSSLPAITLSLLLNLTPIVVLLISVRMLKEVPSRSEVVFILIGILGVILYFYPMDLLSLSVFGLGVGVACLFFNSLSSISGRAINRTGETPFLVVTSVSMSFGSAFLIVIGLVLEGPVILSSTSVLYVLWLSIVNTALAFTLWNKAMVSLRAIDMTLINSIMMPQIVLLSVVFLGEYPTMLDWAGLLLLGMSVVVVQMLQLRRSDMRPVDALGKA